MQSLPPCWIPSPVLAAVPRPALKVMERVPGTAEHAIRKQLEEEGDISVDSGEPLNRPRVEGERRLRGWGGVGPTSFFVQTGMSALHCHADARRRLRARAFPLPTPQPSRQLGRHTGRSRAQRVGARGRQH